MASQSIAPRSPVMEAIEKAKPQFGGRLPEGMTIERFTYGLATSVQKNPALLKCNPGSVLLAAYEAAECGCDLSPSKALGWLIPYGDACQFQPSWRFFVQKAYESGFVKAFNAEVVYSNDKFKIVFAPTRTMIHEPNLGDRGEPIGAYALIQFLNESIDFEFMAKAEIEKHRSHSKQPNSLMWKDFWTEGARKTVIRLFSKRLPHTNPAMERLAELVQRDADADLEELEPGLIELDADSPLKSPGAVPSPAADPRAKLNGDIFFTVGKHAVHVTGNLRPLEKDFRALGGMMNNKEKTLNMPHSALESLRKLCAEKGLALQELDERGNPVIEQEAEPGTEESAAPTMADLYGSQE